MSRNVLAAAVMFASVFLAAGLSGSSGHDRVPAKDSRSNPAIAPQAYIPLSSDGQRRFLIDTAEITLFEIEASRIAIQRGRSAEVRQFAATTLRDRISGDTDLRQLADSVGVALPAQMNASLRTGLAVLAALPTGDFDGAYARAVGIDAQQEALASFERNADNQGGRVQRFAAEQLPALREHLARARRLTRELDLRKMA